MMIVKLTVLSIVITLIYIFIARLWAKSNPSKALRLTLFNECPKWLYGLPNFIVLDIIGILASVVWLLFVR